MACHGAEKQRAGLRLDLREGARKGGDSGTAILPGRGADSLLIRLVSGLEADRVMPPEGDRLAAEDIERLRAWIDAGAEWPEDAPGGAPAATAHWAFQPVVPPVVPLFGPGDPWRGSSSPVDAFIAARLADHGLAPSAPADRVTLIRRLFLVMLGLPPTPEEVAAFVADDRPDAWERWVDRVLADARYGERWGRHWLDVVRFAQSNGFETNRERLNAWRYRDYVIEAFHRDLPYDRFLREQIAGDALGAEVATGFLVGGPVDIVGSPDPALTAQQRADELDDMVNTSGTAFLGLTLGCARCHSHKFDPVDHREYYAFAAVFAGVRHGERPLPRSAEAEAEVAALERRVEDLERRLERFIPRARPVDPESVGEGLGDGAVLRGPVTARFNVERIEPVAARFVRFTILATSGGEPCLDELEVYEGDRNVALASAGTTATASGTLAGHEIHQLAHLNDGRTGNRRSWISHEAGRGWVELALARTARLDRIVWSRDREGDFGDRIPVRYRIDVATEPGEWRLVAGSGDRQPFTPGGAASPAEGTSPYDFAGFPEAEAGQGRRWLAELGDVRARRDQRRRPDLAYCGTFTQPGPTHRLHRGDALQKREVVPPGTLGIFRPVTMSGDEPEQQRRLRLADWMAHPEHPLTARVWVNRVWQHHFGVGLVDTPNDFGRAGSAPTHPELLDWLAWDFVTRGWSTKALHRRILLSATWRQSSAPRPEALARDADARFLWRFPPRRLEAEAIRDSILAVTGVLDDIRGGPGFYLHEVDRENVYHYHPKSDFGPAEFRRMIYAFKVRMEQDAVFGAFDCPDGSLVVPRRSVSTTPLQALNLLNSAFVVDQAERWAGRLRREARDDRRMQIGRAWRLAFGRGPSDEEAAEALALVEGHGLPALGRALLNANEFLFLP